MAKDLFEAVMGSLPATASPPWTGNIFARARDDANTFLAALDREGYKIAPKVIPSEVRTALLEAFGYVPDEHDGEKWCIYQDHSLIVVHPQRIPRIYKRGCGGLYYEIVPDFP